MFDNFVNTRYYRANLIKLFHKSCKNEAEFMKKVWTMKLCYLCILLWGGAEQIHFNSLYWRRQTKKFLRKINIPNIVKGKSLFENMFNLVISWRKKNRETHRQEAATGGLLLKKSCSSNFTKFTGKHPCQILFFITKRQLYYKRSLFFNRVATLSNKRPWHRCFLGNFVKN